MNLFFPIIHSTVQLYKETHETDLRWALELQTLVGVETGRESGILNLKKTPKTCT